MSKEKHELAYIDKMQGMKYKDIADKYCVSVETVKSWQKRHWRNMDRTELECTPGIKSAPVKKKKGAPFGNKNAVGNQGGGAPTENQNALGNAGGAPYGNKNAVTTGEYEKLLFSDFGEEERTIALGVRELDSLLIVRQEIAVLRGRAKGILRRMKQYEKQNLLLSSVKKEGSNVTQYFEANCNRIESCENSLTRVQSAIQKLIQTENKILIDRRKLDLEQIKTNPKGDQELPQIIDDISGDGHG